jgi:meiotic recombination protein REC8
MDIDLPMFGEDLPGGEAFATGGGSLQDHSSEVVESSDTAVAPNRRKKRTARVLPTDTTMELRNKDLSDWNVNYLANMKEASKQKNQHRLAQLAKKNAEFWMWGSGIGGIAARMQGLSVPTPFDRFIGDNLFELFTGVSRKGGARSKRDRDSGIDEATQEESRRVRQRTDELEDEIGRGQEDEGLFIHGGDDVELPREEQPALEDQQRFSEMPWNITASVRGSSAVPRSGKSL